MLSPRLPTSFLFVIPKEIRACRQWSPAQVVTPDATAAQSVFWHANQQITWTADRHGRRTQGAVTVHPSYLLRLLDQDARAREYERFVGDLKIAATQLQRGKAA